MNPVASAKTNRPRRSTRNLILNALLILMLVVAFFQIYVFHTQISFTDGKLSAKTAHVDKRETTREKYNHGIELDNTHNTRGNHMTGISSSGSQNRTDVIVYLAQFGKFHTSYGLQKDANKESITGLSKLNKSLDLLYTNYVNDFPSCDILIFYDTDHGPDNETITLLSRSRPQLQFRELKGQWWSLPHGLKPQERFKWNRPAFSIGYRHMIRWFAILIWPYLANEGYTHVMRMDDDSYLHSRITYNIFDYMRLNNKRYGFRMPVLEEAVGVGYDVIIDSFLEMHTNATSKELVDAFMQERYVGFYNNWFIADISFFLTPPVSLLLDLIDLTDIIYKQRTGDLVIHSTAVRLFLHPNQIQYFRDFTYEHMTLCRRDKCGPWIRNGCPQNGGIVRGVGAHTEEEWMSFSNNILRSFSGKSCDGSLMNGIEFIGAEDIRYCSKIHSRCRPYIESLLGIGNSTSTAV